MNPDPRAIVLGTLVHLEQARVRVDIANRVTSFIDH